MRGDRGLGPDLRRSAALVATVAVAFGTTALVADFTNDFVAYFTNYSSAFAGPQTGFGQMPLEAAISTLGSQPQNRAL